MCGGKCAVASAHCNALHVYRALVTKYTVFKEADKITTHNEFGVEQEDGLVLPRVITVESYRVEQILDGDVSDDR